MILIKVIKVIFHGVKGYIIWGQGLYYMCDYHQGYRYDIGNNVNHVIAG